MGNKERDNVALYLLTITTHHVCPHVGNEVLQGLDAHGPDVHRHDGPHAEEELLHLPERLSSLPEMFQTVRWRLSQRLGDFLTSARGPPRPSFV